MLHVKQKKTSSTYAQLLTFKTCSMKNWHFIRTQINQTVNCGQISCNSTTLKGTYWRRTQAQRSAGKSSGWLETHSRGPAGRSQNYWTGEP